MRTKSLLLLLLIGSFGITTSFAKSKELKPRLVVMTDIGDCKVEPDDMESAIRLMAFADMFEIEAVMTTVGWNCDPYPADWAMYLDQVVEAYSIDVMNLMARSGQKEFLPLEKENGSQSIGYWPSAEYIRSRTMKGSWTAGIKAIGEGNDSEGSNFLIRLADENDPRPIYVATWGSGNTLAQAIWKVKNTRSEADLKTFLRKFRVYTISDQDMRYAMRMDRAYSSHQWIRQEFRDDLQFVWDEGTWQLFCDLGKQNWKFYQSDIQGHGAMGKIYPNYLWGVEGDTPSFLYITPNGLSDPEDPSQAGWGGCHKQGICPDSLTYAWTSWMHPQRGLSESYLRKFYPDQLNDFRARMQWADEGRGNVNPVVRINGKTSSRPIHLKAKAGKQVKLDAVKSYDKDGDSLTFLWWQQTDVENNNTVLLSFTSTSLSSITFTIPQDAQGRSLHIICEVHDNGPFNLVAYQRVIIDCI